MDRVAPGAGEVRRALELQRHFAMGGVDAQEDQYFLHRVIDLDQLRRQFLLAQQVAHPPDDFAGALVVFANVGKDLPHFVQSRRLGHEKHLGRLRVAQDRAERLVQFMGDDCGELADGSDPCHMGELLAIALKIDFYPFPLGDVDHGTHPAHNLTPRTAHELTSGDKPALGDTGNRRAKLHFKRLAALLRALDDGHSLRSVVGIDTS